MSFLGDSERLSQRRYALVVLRVLLDEESRLVYGEVLDSHGVCHGRFKDWRRLPIEVQSYLAQHAQGSTPT